MSLDLVLERKKPFLFQIFFALNTSQEMCLELSSSVVSEMSIPRCDNY